MKIFSFFLLPHYFFFVVSDEFIKNAIIEDFKVFSTGYNLKGFTRMNFGSFSTILINCRELRTLFYYRINSVTKKYHMGKILELILKPFKEVHIGTKFIGKGLYIEHGSSTYIHAERIGDYCWINQNVTIGAGKHGIPTIGNYVKIHTGAVVVGKINIGNNVVIGANATVVKDIPDNCVVVPASSFICKKNGVKCKIKL
jgi:serine O-acetyltransferase